MTCKKKTSKSRKKVVAGRKKVSVVGVGDELLKSYDPKQYDTLARLNLAKWFCSQKDVHDMISRVKIQELLIWLRKASSTPEARDLDESIRVHDLT